MIDTTTSVETGFPPVPHPTPTYTKCDLHCDPQPACPTVCVRPYSDLPHTGGTPMLFGASAVLLVGLVTVWATRRPKRYAVRRGTDPQRPWIVFDRHLSVAVADFVRKDAAKHRAQTYNSPREPSRKENP